MWVTLQQDIVPNYMFWNFKQYSATTKSSLDVSNQ